MSALVEFLQTQGRTRARTAQETRLLLDEWQKEVFQFVHWLREVLEQADVEKVLFLRATRHFLREERFGEYEVPGLDVVLGSTEVRVIPRARFNVGRLSVDESRVEYPIEGRIDLTDGGRVHTANRVRTPDGHRWFFTGRKRESIRPLSPEVVQDVVLDLLR